MAVDQRLKDEYPEFTITYAKRPKFTISAGMAAFARLVNVEIRVDRFLNKFKFFSIKRNSTVYLRKLTGIAVEAAVLLCVVWLFCTLMLYVSLVLWRLYAQTHMGQQYLQIFPQRAELINEIFGYQAYYLAGDATLTAFVICIGVGAVGRFLHINRCLFHSRGLIGKIFFWGLGLTGLVAYYLYMEYGFSSWEAIAVVAAVPTLCLFSNCYEYADRLLPELGDGVRLALPYVKKLKDNIIAALR